MSWICPQCNLSNVNVNEHCADSNCKTPRTQIEGVDKFDKLLSEIRLSKLDTVINLYLSKDWRTESVTPQEQLFADLFNGYKTKPSVNAMTDLELRAHREELVHIATEAKACIYAVDDILKERKPKGIQGFVKSVNIDEASSDAINAIKERQKRLTKQEKIQAGLEKLGISTIDAVKLMSAGTILGRLKQSAKSEVTTQTETPGKLAFNPFAKKE